MMAATSMSKVSLALYPLLLACILGTGIAPLTATSSGWAYNYTSHANLIYGTRSSSVWVGYVRGSGTITLLLHRMFPAILPEWHYLREYGGVGAVFGWLEAAFLGLSLVLAMAIFVFWACGAANRRSGKSSLLLHTVTAPLSIIFGVVLFGVTVAFYILLAIGTKRGLQLQTGVGLTPWPSWAWFIAAINSWLWLGLSRTSICERRKALRAEKQATQGASGGPGQDRP